MKKNIMNASAILFIIAICLYPMYRLWDANRIKHDKEPKEQELTQDEKDFPIHDSYGHKFKTMPTVYHKDIYIYSKHFSGYPCGPDNWATFEQVWIDGKPAVPGIIHVTEYGYTPFYTATVSPSGITQMYNGSGKTPDTAKKMTPHVYWLTTEEAAREDEMIREAHPTQKELDDAELKRKLEKQPTYPITAEDFKLAAKHAKKKHKVNKPDSLIIEIPLSTVDY